MITGKAQLTSNTCEWETPQDLFDRLDAEFHFTLDVCATHDNAKCGRYFTREHDGLKQKWGGIVWCNPPYGKGIIQWVQKAYHEAENGVTTVMLLPARTDTKWFHDYVLPVAELRFIRGRLKFGEAANNAPFPSIICIFKGK